MKRTAILLLVVVVLAWVGSKMVPRSEPALAAVPASSQAVKASDASYRCREESPAGKMVRCRNDSRCPAGCPGLVEGPGLGEVQRRLRELHRGIPSGRLRPDQFQEQPRRVHRLQALRVQRQDRDHRGTRQHHRRLERRLPIGGPSASPEDEPLAAASVNQRFKPVATRQRRSAFDDIFCWTPHSNFSPARK